MSNTRKRKLEIDSSVSGAAQPIVSAQNAAAPTTTDSAPTAPAPIRLTIRKEKYQIFEKVFEKYRRNLGGHAYKKYELLLRLIRDAMVQVYNITSDHFIRKARDITAKNIFFLEKFKDLIG